MLSKICCCALSWALVAASLEAVAQRVAAPRGSSSQGPVVGSLAPDFTLADAQGKAVSLRDFRGQYVLIDFWASWCGFCRRESPDLVAAFAQYKSRNFTILGVASIRPSHPELNREAWLQAIRADGLSWTQVVGDTAVSRRYGVKYIPQNMLVGPDGRVVAKNIRSKHLRRQLAAVLPAPAPQ